MMAVNAAPGSCPGMRTSPTTRTWALEETGTNCVRACTMPRMIASKKDTGAPRGRSARLRGGGDGDGAARTICGTGRHHRTRTQYAVPGMLPGTARSIMVKMTCRVRARYGAGTSAIVVVILVVVVLVVLVVVIVAVVLVVELLEIIEVVEVVVLVLVVAVEDDQRGGR